MSTVDIITVVDTASIMADVSNGTLAAGTLDNPTNLGSYGSSDKYIFMIADGSYVVQNSQTHSELTVNCDVGDSIRWTVTNPSADYSYNCILYNFASAAIGTAITAPACNTSAAVSYYNSLQDPTVPVPSAVMYSVWVCDTLASSPSVQYSWSFQIIDTLVGNVVGYFLWDPFITINAT